MPLILDPTYITANEFKALTRVADQRTMADATLKPFMLHAEYLIDSYIGAVVPYADDQDLKFPTSENGVSTIPNDVKKACIEIVSDLILKGEPTSSTSAGNVKKEAWSGSGYSREMSEGTSKNIINELPPIAVSLLKQWAGNIAPATY
jgi:hypothetical protein